MAASGAGLAAVAGQLLLNHVCADGTEQNGRAEREALNREIPEHFADHHTLF